MTNHNKQRITFESYRNITEKEDEWLREKSKELIEQEGERYSYGYLNWDVGEFLTNVFYITLENHHRQLLRRVKVEMEQEKKNV